MTHYSNKFFHHLIATAVLLLTSTTFGQVLFEGYSKVLVNNVHAGYVVQRYEYDTKAKQFISISYLRTGPLGNNLTESLKAKADQNFLPLNYQYTSKLPNQTKTIDATFDKQKMLAVVKVGTETVRVQKDLPKGTFLSTFLAYIMLKNGIAPGRKFTYSAVAEEDAEVFEGEAFVKAQEKYQNVDAFSVLCSFKDSKWQAYMSIKGETMATRSPLQKISVELVRTAQEATQGFEVNPAHLKALFGNVPVGDKHPLTSAPAAPLATPTAPTAEGKKGP